MSFHFELLELFSDELFRHAGILSYFPKDVICEILFCTEIFISVESTLYSVDEKHCEYASLELSYPKVSGYLFQTSKYWNRLLLLFQQLVKPRKRTFSMCSLDCFSMLSEEGETHYFVINETGIVSVLKPKHIFSMDWHARQLYFAPVLRPNNRFQVSEKSMNILLDDPNAYIKESFGYAMHIFTSDNSSDYISLGNHSLTSMVDFPQVDYHFLDGILKYLEFIGYELVISPIGYNFSDMQPKNKYRRAFQADYRDYAFFRKATTLRSLEDCFPTIVEGYYTFSTTFDSSFYS